MIMKKEALKIEKAIDKWLNDLENKLKSTEGNPIIDSYFRSIYAVFANYNFATIILIQNNAKLPTMALLRIQYELFVKVLWCIHNTSNFQEVEARFQRWAKSTGKMKIKLFKSFVDSNKLSEENKEWYKIHIEKLSSVLNEFPGSIKGMPNITGNGGMFDHISEVFNDNVVPSLYGQFSPAVHIDTSVLAESIERKGDILNYKGDLDYRLEDLRHHCFSLVYMFVKIFYVFYKWDCAEIEKEYFALIPSCNK